MIDLMGPVSLGQKPAIEMAVGYRGRIGNHWRYQFFRIVNVDKQAKLREQLLGKRRVISGD